MYKQMLIWTQHGNIATRSIRTLEALWPRLRADLQGVDVCSGVATIFEIAIDNL